MNTAERIASAERRLAELETLGQTLTRIHEELVAYREALTTKLAHLQPIGIEPPVDETRRPVRREASGAERRTARRRIGNPISVFIANAMISAEPVTGWVTDRSQHGLGVWADEEEPIGSELRVRPAKATETGWWARVVVRHCRHDRGRWVVGCEFVEQPPWNQLKAFG